MTKLNLPLLILILGFSALCTGCPKKPNGDAAEAAASATPNAADIDDEKGDEKADKDDEKADKDDEKADEKAKDEKKDEGGW